MDKEVKIGFDKNAGRHIGTHKHLETSEVYDRLREAHHLIKEIVFMDGFDELGGQEQNAIESVHSVLYLAEGHFTDF